MYVDKTKLEKVLRDWKHDSKLGHIRKISYRINGSTLLIYTSRPAMMLGKNSSLINKYTNKTTSLGVTNIRVVEVADKLI